MPRIRTIKPDFFLSEDIGELTVNSRLLYIALWLHADREGKMKYNRISLKAQCMPFEMELFEDCMTELQEKGHVFIYEIEGKKYLKLPTFTEHQKPHNTEAKSKIPEPNVEKTVKPPLKDVEPPTGKERKGKEGKEALSLFAIKFYELYPKARTKQESLDYIENKLKPDESLQEKIIQSLTDQIAAKQAAKENGEFFPEFPDPIRWLKKSRWEDSVTAATDNREAKAV